MLHLHRVIGSLLTVRHGPGASVSLWAVHAQPDERESLSIRMVQRYGAGIEADREKSALGALKRDR
jgi:hypothetical protein